jgi:hypothetical protein
MSSLFFSGRPPQRDFPEQMCYTVSEVTQFFVPASVHALYNFCRKWATVNLN